MEIEHKFEANQYSRRTEIEINLVDEDKLKDGFEYIEIKFTILELAHNCLKFKSSIRLNRTQLNLLKGRVMPKKPKYKPKSKVIPIYDESIVVGIDKDGYLIYKQIN